MIEVELTDTELIVCKLIGNLRTLSNRANKVKDAGQFTNLETDEDGVLGEFAFCKHWNIYFDADVSPRAHTHDCLLKGKKIDVKTTRVKTGRLLATKKVNPDIDIFVLAIVDGNKVSFPGYLLAGDMYQDKNLTNLGHGELYAVQQSELRQWKDQT
jgi:hypothetical protein